MPLVSIVINPSVSISIVVIKFNDNYQHGLELYTVPRWWLNSYMLCQHGGGWGYISNTSKIRLQKIIKNCQNQAFCLMTII